LREDTFHEFLTVLQKLCKSSLSKLSLDPEQPLSTVYAYDSVIITALAFDK
jgi:hypothetical protein